MSLIKTVELPSFALVWTTLVPVNIPLPERMDLNGGNLPVNWQRFCRAWSKDPENPGRNKERRAVTLLTCIGSYV